MSYADSYRKAAEDLIAVWYIDPEAFNEAVQAIGVTTSETAESFEALIAVLRGDT